MAIGHEDLEFLFNKNCPDKLGNRGHLELSGTNLEELHRDRFWRNCPDKLGEEYHVATSAK